MPKSEEKQDNGVYMGIDLGINNLIACYISTGKTFIISGRQLLSINRYYDKTIGYYWSIAYSEQSERGIKYPKDTRRLQLCTMLLKTLFVLSEEEKRGEE